MANIQDSLTGIKRVIYQKGSFEGEPVIVEFDNDKSGRIATWYKPYTLTMPSLPTGVGSCVVNRSSCNYPNKTGNILTGPGEAELYHGDSISVSATAATGYNDPTVKFKGGGTSWSSVSDNVTVEMTAGSVKSYTLTVPSKPSGVSACTISRTSSPLASASTGTLVTAGSSQTTATIYHGDVLSISATAATGYNVTPSLSQTTVSGNVTASISALPKAYTLSVNSIQHRPADIWCERISSNMPGASSRIFSLYGDTSASDQYDNWSWTVYYGDVIRFYFTKPDNYNNPIVLIGGVDYSGKSYTITGNVSISEISITIAASWHTLGSSSGSYSGTSGYSKFRISANCGDTSYTLEFSSSGSQNISGTKTSGGDPQQCICGEIGYHWCACYGEYYDPGDSPITTVNVSGTVTFTKYSTSILVSTSGSASVYRIEGWG